MQNPTPQKEKTLEMLKAGETDVLKGGYPTPLFQSFLLIHSSQTSSIPLAFLSILSD